MKFSTNGQKARNDSLLELVLEDDSEDEDELSDDEDDDEDEELSDDDDDEDDELIELLLKEIPRLSQ